MGKGVFPVAHEHTKSMKVLHEHSSDDNLTSARSPHCSHCGHPGSKRGHLKADCEYCILDGSQNCIEKPTGFRCRCPMCDRVHPY